MPLFNWPWENDKADIFILLGAAELPLVGGNLLR